MKTRRIVYLSVLLAVATVINYAESLIPSFGLPGVRLGLANIVILLILYNFSLPEALTVTILRVVLVGLIRGTLFQVPFFMSLAGAILSLITMFALKKAKIFTEIGVSIGGAFIHVVSQIIVLSIFMKTITIVYYLPILLISSLLTGIFVGIVVMKVREKYFIMNKEQEKLE